jgi:hypothetical protein
VGKFGDISGEYGPAGWFWMDAGGGGGGGGAGFPGGAIPPGPSGNFLGGRAPSAASPTLPTGYGEYGYRRNRLRPFGMGQPMMEGMGGMGGKAPWGPGPGAQIAPGKPWGQSQTPPGWSLFGGGPGGSPQTWNPAWGIAGLLQHAAGGGDPSFGGAFGLNPPEAIMSGVRSRAISDAGARERSDRLRLAGRSDVDPSTYGFQSLMSGLQSGSDISRSLGAADLGLRQGQLENYWRMLMALLGEGGTSDRAQLQANSGGGFDWGGLARGAGQIGGSLLMPGGYFGPKK